MCNSRLQWCAKKRRKKTKKNWEHYHAISCWATGSSEVNPLKQTSAAQRGHTEWKGVPSLEICWQTVQRLQTLVFWENRVITYFPYTCVTVVLTYVQFLWKQNIRICVQLWRYHLEFQLVRQKWKHVLLLYSRPLIVTTTKRPASCSWDRAAQRKHKHKCTHFANAEL